MNGYRTRVQLTGLSEHRPLFLKAPLRVRIARWWRRTVFGWL